jgi:hypothetical protein
MLVPGGVLQGKEYKSGCYVKPCIIEASNDMPIVQHETFAPILYIMKYKTLDEAIATKRCGAGIIIGYHDQQHARSRSIFIGEWKRLRHCQCKHRHQRCRNRRSILVAKKKPVAAARAAAMPGKTTCADKPTPSTTAPNFRWHRAYGLSCKKNALCFPNTTRHTNPIPRLF